jgi:bifunctional UDP-N-acetylglucosamine pyrophosphorylase/glucosamine-1-phosphate N-acetyltransferase
MEKLTTVILAAGFGKRMKSKFPKVLHKIGGKPMVQHVIRLAQTVGSDEIICVIGHEKEKVRQALASEPVMFAVQEQQLGTGHAVSVTEHLITGGTILVLFGDAPLLTPETLTSFLRFFEDGAYDAAILSAVMDEPTGYGRIVRSESGAFMRIVEHKDADEATRAITEINSGIGLFKTQPLKAALGALTNDNKQGEYYLTDAFEHIKNVGGKVGAFIAAHAEEIMGVNDRVALAEADAIFQQRLKKKWMLEGVTMRLPETIYIEADVEIGPDTILHPGTVLKGKTVIGAECEIGPGADIEDCQIADGVKVTHSTLIRSEVDSDSKIGPYAYLRPDSRIGKSVKIGDFVEVKNTYVGDGSKISHLTYAGDGEIGKNVNLGCGVVFVNYDGTNKYKTIVEDDAFVGCNSNLIAPVTVGRGAYVAAGSTITEDVPEEALGIARQRQVNKTGWTGKYAKKK